MLTLIMLAYVALVVVAFKVIKIKVNAISVAAAVFLGVFVLGGILIAWKFSAPITDQMTLHKKVNLLLSNQDSKELITKIHVDPEQPVKKGDPLYEVDSRPNQYTVNQWTAQVAASQQSVKQAEAGVEVAAAQVEEANASQALTQAQLDTALKTQEINPSAVAKLNVEVAQKTYDAKVAATENEVAQQSVAEYALLTAQNSLKADQAQLELAKLNLSQNVVRAPSDGYVANWQAMEGTMTTTVRTSAQGTFLDTSIPAFVAAVFPQNLLKNVESGNDVEIAFKSLPGKIATGKVDAVLEYTGEGQLLTGPQIPHVKDLNAKGFLVVRITLDDQELAQHLPLGADGSVAIYTKVMEPFQLISKITIRIKMWMNYLPV